MGSVFAAQQYDFHLPVRRCDHGTCILVTADNLAEKPSFARQSAIRAVPTTIFTEELIEAKLRRRIATVDFA